MRPIQNITHQKSKSYDLSICHYHYIDAPTKRGEIRTGISRRQEGLTQT